MAASVANSRLVQRVRHWPRRTVITVLVIVAVVAAIRLALPYVIRSQINARLANIPGYVGHVDTISLSVLRGAYALDGIAIYKEENKVREPFFLARRIDFSLAWRELWHRKFVGDITIDRPQVEFIKSTTKEASTTSDADRRWQEVVKDIFPIDITFLEVRDGVIRYVDRSRTPPVDAFIKNLHVLATGLRNRPQEGGGEFPAQINVDGDTLGGGLVTLSMATEPLAAQPHFHLSFKVRKVNLPALNQSLQAYAGVNVSKGTFELVGEMAGRDGGFQGYMKPFFNELEFKADKHEGIGERLWEKIVAGVAWLVKNKPRDQVATRVPFQGRFGSPTVGMWATVRNVFRHGFVRAFNPTIEDSIKPDNILPNGKSANGQNVADVKNDAPKKGAKTPPTDNKTKTGDDANRAGAPTGRSSEPTR